MITKLGFMALLLYSAIAFSAEKPAPKKEYKYPGVGENCPVPAGELTRYECYTAEYEKALKYLGEIEIRHVKNSKNYEETSKMWLKFIDSTCFFDAEKYNANSNMSVYAQCKLNLISLRIRQIETLNNCIDAEKCGGEFTSLSNIMSPGNNF